MRASIYGTQEQQITSDRKNRGAKIVRFKSVPLIVATYELPAVARTPRHYCVRAWERNRRAPVMNYAFRSAEEREKYVREYAERLAEREKRRKERNAENRRSANAAEHYAVGDVLYNSWGYDQTNIDYYQVTEVKARSIVIREIASNTNDHGGPYGGKCAPRRFEYVGKPIRKVVKADGRIRWQFGGGAKWTGKALYCSSYH